eukprot:TRINITY_DN1264_c0_g1_i2.p1 TRINITY_DN1264_c0_g1~~TRINITY_DN1264_c0_g1_i2.p1  ORF type:complete len:147 (+),score=11.04 TRINITY_DN1264_c0_g1_i2:218-658(+)
MSLFVLSMPYLFSVCSLVCCVQYSWCSLIICPAVCLPLQQIEDKMELEMRQFIDEKCKENTANNPVVQKKIAAQKGRRANRAPSASQGERKPSPLNPARNAEETSGSSGAKEDKASNDEDASKAKGKDKGPKSEDRASLVDSEVHE